MRLLIDTAFMACVLGIILGALNIFIWEPLGTIENLRSANPSSVHGFIIVTTFIACLVFVGCTARAIGESRANAKEAKD